MILKDKNSMMQLQMWLTVFHQLHWNFNRFCYP